MTRNDDVNKLRQTLEKALDEADYTDIEPHIKRDAVIVVGHGMNILEVAMKVALDDTKVIDAWIGEGKLGKPTLEQIGLWSSQPHKPFLALIVAPFVLVQEVTAH